MEIDDQKKKSVNNYRQLDTICERLFKGSTISNNYQQLFGGGQQLATIGNNYFWGGHQLSTIINNFFAPVVAITAVVRANTVSNGIEDN